MENNNQTKTLMPIVELFKKSFDVYQKKVWTLAGLALFSLVGFVVLLPFAAAAFFVNYKMFTKGQFDLVSILIGVLLMLIGILLCIVLSLWAKVALFYAVKEHDINFKKALSIAWPQMGSFFWVGFLHVLAVLGGFILFVIPGIIFSVWFIFSDYIFVWDGIKGTGALKRSKQLVKGIWWPVFLRFLTIAIILFLISSIKFFGPFINLFFIAPFAIVYMMSLYEDVKSVKG